VPDVSESAPTPVRRDAETEVADTDLFPEWFSQFLNDRQTRKPSAHGMKAYRQDFIAIATLVAGGNSTQLAVTDITKDSMRSAFAAYAPPRLVRVARPLAGTEGLWDCLHEVR
jgi:integrase/recombinase XerC